MSDVFEMNATNSQRPGHTPACRNRCRDGVLGCASDDFNYEPAPVYERRVYVEPPVYYAPRVYADAYLSQALWLRLYRLAAAAFLPAPFWHHRHHGW
jgi:hypothetical protein